MWTLDSSQIGQWDFLSAPIIKYHLVWTQIYCSRISDIAKFCRDPAKLLTNPCKNVTVIMNSVLTRHIPNWFLAPLRWKIPKFTFFIRICFKLLKVSDTYWSNCLNEFIFTYLCQCFKFSINVSLFNVWININGGHEEGNMYMYVTRSLCLLWICFMVIMNYGYEEVNPMVPRNTLL